MTVEIEPWDPVDHLQTEEAVLAYLDAALEDGDPALIAAALGDIARSHGVTRIAREAGLSREGLRRALSPAENSELGTALKLLGALGVRLGARAA